MNCRKHATIDTHLNNIAALSLQELYVDIPSSSALHMTAFLCNLSQVLYNLNISDKSTNVLNKVQNTILHEVDCILSKSFKEDAQHYKQRISDIIFNLPWLRDMHNIKSSAWKQFALQLFVMVLNKNAEYQDSPIFKELIENALTNLSSGMERDAEVMFFKNIIPYLCDYMLEKICATLIATVFTQVNESSNEYLLMMSQLLDVVRNKCLLGTCIVIEAPKIDVKNFLLRAVRKKNIVMADMFLSLCHISPDIIKDLELKYGLLKELLNEDIFIKIFLLLCKQNTDLVDMFISIWTNDEIDSGDVVGHLLPIVCTILRMKSYKNVSSVLGMFILSARMCPMCCVQCVRYTLALTTCILAS